MRRSWDEERRQRGRGTSPLLAWRVKRGDRDGAEKIQSKI